MPTTKLSEIRLSDAAALLKRVSEAKKELMELRFQSSIGQLEKSHRVPELKREIARSLTVLGEKAKGVVVTPKAKAALAEKPKRAPKAAKAADAGTEKPKRAPRATKAKASE
jgi:large subunit ribosomal protein L29